MFTGMFRDRMSSRGPPRGAAPTASQALEELLQSRVLRPYRFSRCEIGPFVIDHVCRERSLVVELQRRADVLHPQRAMQQQRHAARTAFLNEMGYAVLSVYPHELLSRPRQVLERIRAAMA